MIRRFALKSAALALALGLALPAGAATIKEGDLKDGEFSKHWKSPTILDAWVDGVIGTGRAGQFDIFVLTGLPKGAQTLSFGFEAPADIKHNYAGGGEIRFSTKPFEWGWDGTKGGAFDVRFGDTTDLLKVVLGADFVGPLYVGLYFTYGKDIAYSVTTDAKAAPTEMPPAVPLPGAGVLMGTALAAAALAGMRRKRRG
jgi:hypothetical protein